MGELHLDGHPRLLLHVEEEPPALRHTFPHGRVASEMRSPNG
jgi:hypothetical protein